MDSWSWDLIRAVGSVIVVAVLITDAVQIRKLKRRITELERGEIDG